MHNERCTSGSGRRRGKPTVATPPGARVLLSPKLKGPVKWSCYYLYVILDVFSRYVVGWMVANRESARLAKRLIEETCRRQGIGPGQLTIHADRGPSMGSKTVAQLLDDLGIEKSHSRPHVSNDNPYSEAQFKTLKYRPEFPGRFGSAEDARSSCGALFRLVQRRPLPQRPRLDDAGRCALWACAREAGAPCWSVGARI